MSPPTDPSPSPEPEEEPPERPRGPIFRWHDTRMAFCKKCNKRILFTDSQSMVAEAKAANIPEQIQFVVPIEAMFQGERTKIFPVTCPCGGSYLSFVDVVNREKIEQTKRDLLPYYPQIAEDTDLRKRYLEPKRRDVLLTREEFAARVLAERNQMVRDALVRKLQDRGLWAQPGSTRLVAGFIADTVVGP